MKPSGIFVTGGRGGYKAVREGAGSKIGTGIWMGEVYKRGKIADFIFKEKATFGLQ